MQEPLEQLRVLHEVAHAEELFARAHLGLRAELLGQLGLVEQLAQELAEAFEIEWVVEQQAVHAVVI